MCLFQHVCVVVRRSKVIHLHGNRVRRCRAGQINVIPAGSIVLRFRVSRFERQAQGHGAASAMRNVKRNGAQKFDALRPAHD